MTLLNPPPLILPQRHEILPPRHYVPPPAQLPRPYDTQQVNPNGGSCNPYNFNDGKNGLPPRLVEPLFLPETKPVIEPKLLELPRKPALGLIEQEPLLDVYSIIQRKRREL